MRTLGVVLAIAAANLVGVRQPCACAVNTSLADPLLGVGAQSSSHGFGLEVTGSASVIGPHLSLGLTGLGVSRPYLYGEVADFCGEVAGWLFLTLGVGAGAELGPTGPRAAGHLFVGLPLPVMLLKRPPGSST
jgi:hypothetical protein